MKLFLVVFAALIGLCLSAPLFLAPESDKPAKEIQLEEKRWGRHPWLERNMHFLLGKQKQLKGKFQDLMANLTLQMKKMEKNLISETDKKMHKEGKKFLQVKEALVNQIMGLKGRLAGGKEDCEDKHTEWQPSAYETVMYLDKHPINCPPMFNLHALKLTRQGPKNIRYEYQCCKTTY